MKILNTIIILSLLMVFSLVCKMDAAADTPKGNVRVVLENKVETASFKTVGNYELVDQSSGKPLLRLGKGETWQVKIKSGMIEVHGPAKNYGPFNGPVMVREAAVGNAIIINGRGERTYKSSIAGLNAINGAGHEVSLNSVANPSVLTAVGKMPLSGNGDLNLISYTGIVGSKRYRGSIEFRVESGSLTVVNELNIEDYLCGVVASEMPASWPAEALKTQAVAARNYALQRVESTRGSSFNVTCDQSSQVYGGYDAESPATNKAVEDTRGIVMLSGGNLVAAFFHSSSGGFTENSEDIWQEKLPYLRWKADPFDKNDAYYNWQVNYTAEQLKDKLTGAGYKFGRVTDLQELARTSSGARVKKIAVKGEGPAGEPLTVEIYNADNIRIALGLKSALFTFVKKYDKNKKLTGVSFTGSGWGHGLGISQYGVRGMASAGYNYQDILKYYYTGAILAKDYGR
ncbi:MAG: SpoIID/LytB domain-containing protein [Desulfotomaculaceae bacterium]